MKNIITFLTLLALVASVPAQFVPGPAPQTALVTGTGFVIPGLTKTNFSTSYAPNFKAGRDGVFIYISEKGTNALTVTNCVATIGLIGGPEGTNVIANQTYTVSFTTGGAGFSIFGTNIPSSAANILNAPNLRLLSITNVNSESIIISNITAYVK